MNKIEIKDFKKFLNERNVLLMFSTCYRQHRLTVNPPTLDEYLEKARVENVIPQAFVYPQKLYGKEFWLSIHDEWIKLIQQSRAEKAESDQLESLGLEIIDVHSRSSCLGLPKNTCSLSLRGGKRFTLNGGLKKGGQETFDSHAAHPKPTDCRCGADVQSSERHRGEVQTWHYQFTV